VEKLPWKKTGQDLEGGEKSILRQQKQIIAMGFGYSGRCWGGFVLSAVRQEKKRAGETPEKKAAVGKGERSGGRGGGWRRPPYK